VQSPEQAIDSGLHQRLEKIEAGLEKLQLQVESQNTEIKRQTRGYQKALVGKAKKLIKSERERNIKLWEDNKRLRAKLKELELKSRTG
jgi:hypothetical protein